jgi:LysR family transcriptional regulator, nod-box dependent transcriptional activator
MRFRGLDLNLLLALDVLFQEMSVTRAATRLNTTQSNMSGILARLRAHFQDELLVPYARALRRTPLAEQLQGPLHEAIVQIESLVTVEGGFDPASSTRHFRVEFPDHLIPVLLPSITARITNQAPDIVVEFSLPRGDPAPLLYRGELDLVVTPHSYRAPDYPFIPLLKDEMVVVGWKGNPALSSAKIGMETLRSLPMIIVRFDPRRILGAITEDQISLFEGNHHRLLFAPTYSSVPLLLIGLKSFACLHRNLAESFATRLPLVIRSLPFKSPEHEDVVMYHPNRANDSGLMWLADQFVQAAAQSVRDRPKQISTRQRTASSRKAGNKAKKKREAIR